MASRTVFDDDHPRAVVLAAIAVLCGCGGFVVAHALVPTGRRQPAVEPSMQSELERSGPPAEAGPAPTTDAIETAQGPDEQPTRATDSAVRADDPASELASPQVVRRGQVAYLRCDGVPQRAGAVPCPRDDAMESVVWTALESLARCPVGAGELDLVLEFRGASAPEVRSRDRFAADVTRLDAVVALDCVRVPLAGVRQTMGSTRLVASFRVAVAPR